VNATAGWLLAATGLVAVLDWIAVGFGWKVAEYVLKPATMVVLIAAALALDPVDRPGRTWFVVALALSLVGDVFLMLPAAETWFVPGLGSFLLGHVAYLVGLVVMGINGIVLAVGIVVVALAVALVAPRVVAGARRTDPRLGGPVGGYVLVISAMVACAIGSTVALAFCGAVLFYLSDLAIGWSRFVRDFRGSRLVIITTYHAEQVLLVASLVVSR
jgi:uncharacterized membrane protein YhhN